MDKIIEEITQKAVNGPRPNTMYIELNTVLKIIEMYIKERASENEEELQELRRKNDQLVYACNDVLPLFEAFFTTGDAIKLTFDVHGKEKVVLIDLREKIEMLTSAIEGDE